MTTNAIKFETLAEADKYVLSLAASAHPANWTSRRESMGKGTPFHREWETFSLNGVPVLERRAGSADAGVYKLVASV